MLEEKCVICNIFVVSNFLTSDIKDSCLLRISKMYFYVMCLFGFTLSLYKMHYFQHFALWSQDLKYDMETIHYENVPSTCSERAAVQKLGDKIVIPSVCKQRRTLNCAQQT